MARWLREEEVKKLEEQRALRERVKEAGFSQGLPESERLEQVFKKAQENAIERRRRNILANPNAETDTTLRHSVLRDDELRSARAHEMDRLGKELATREEEARQRRFGMAEQGMEAAKANREAAIRAAELQTAGAEKVAGINKDKEVEVAKLNADSNKDMNKEKLDNEYDRTKLMADAQVRAEEVKANAQASQQYAENLMKTRQVDERVAMQYAQRAIEEARRMVNASKRNGRPTMTFEQAIAKVHEQNTNWGRLPGRER